MKLVVAKCTNCGGVVNVDKDKDAAICEYCGSAYIVEKAIQNFNLTTNISAETVQVNGNILMNDKKSELLTRAKQNFEFEEYSLAWDYYKEYAQLYPNEIEGWIGMIKSHTEDYQLPTRKDLDNIIKKIKVLNPENEELQEYFEAMEIIEENKIAQDIEHWDYLYHQPLDGWYADYFYDDGSIGRIENPTPILLSSLGFWIKENHDLYLSKGREIVNELDKIEENSVEYNFKKLSKKYKYRRDLLAIDFLSKVCNLNIWEKIAQELATGYKVKSIYYYNVIIERKFSGDEYSDDSYINKIYPLEKRIDEDTYKKYL